MADPMDYLQDPELLAAREAAASAGQLATDYAAAAGTLPAKLTQAVKEKLDYNRGLIEEKNKAFENYTTAAPAAREKYSNIWDPFTREKLVAQERATAYTPYANSSDILKTSMGNMNDIINNALGAFRSAVTAAQGASQSARQRYQDAFDWANKMADMEMQKQQEARLSAGGSGGGEEGFDPTGLFEVDPATGQLRLRGTGNTSQPTAPVPRSPISVTRQNTTPGLTFLGGPGFSGIVDKPRLYNPKTGKTYEYDGYDDPDYINDKNSGMTEL